MGHDGLSVENHFGDKHTGSTSRIGLAKAFTKTVLA